MPGQTVKSGFAAKVGAKVGAAVLKHANDAKKLPGGGELPEGIENGIARLIDCRFDTYKEGKHKDEYYFLVAATVPVLLLVAPPGTPWTFAILFGLAMGADYMLIPLMAARQFGVNTLARAMAIILPVNTIGQTWFPQLVSVLREHSADYRIPLYTVFALAMAGALAIFLLPSRGTEK